MSSPGTTRVTRGFFVLVALIYTCVFPYMGWINNPNENTRTYMTMAIVEDHTFQIDGMVARHGWTNDMALVPSRNPREAAHHYAVKAPAISYAGVPVYWAFSKIAPIFGHPVPTLQSAPEERAFWLRATTFALRLVVVQIPSFLFLVFFERYLRRFTADTVLRLAATAAVGLGTNYLAYALMYVSHTLFAVAAFTSFAITEIELARAPSRERRPTRAFWAGFFAGLATLLEYHAFPVSFVLALYAAIAFRRPTRLLALTAGGLIDVAALMFFQARAFGNPLTPGHLMVENPAFAREHHKGLYGMEIPSWDTLVSLSTSNAFGFFGTSPFMWLGLLAIPFGLVFAYGTRSQRRHRRKITFVWLLTMFALFATVSSANNWRGGWTVGPRYLGAAPPFFALGAVMALEAVSSSNGWRRAIARGLAVGLAVASAFTIGLVSLVYNTLPESVTRPLVQIALPFLRVGFVPYHVGHLVGLDGRTTYYVVLALGFFAPLALIALWKAHERLRPYLARIAITLATLCVALLGPWSSPSAAEGGDGSGDTRGLSQSWEPRGHDRIAELRLEAERHGARGPCLWYKLADLERIVHWDAEAAHDERRATEPRSVCSR